MKITAISGDMAVKLAIGAAVLGLGAWMLHKAKSSIGAMLPPLDSINPASPDNVVYSGLNKVGESIVTSPDGAGKNADGSWSVGGWLYDITHPGTTDAIKAMSGPVAPATVTPTTAHYDEMGNYTGTW